MFNNIFETTPTHINEKGVKWWLDKDSTVYAKSKKLRGVTAWLVEEPNGAKSRVLVKGKNILFSVTSLTELTTRVDILAAVKPRKKPLKSL